MRRLSAALKTGLVLLLPVFGLAACSGDDEGEARAAVQSVADALMGAADGSADKALFADEPFTGTDGEMVLAEYTKIIDGMDGLVPKVSVADVDTEAETATLTWSWPVADDADPWTYDTTVDLAHTDAAWTVAWAPSVVEPSLIDGDRLEVTSEPTTRGDITGAGGAELVTARPVVRVGIDRTLVGAARAPASAKALAELVDIDVASYVKAVKGAGAKAFVEAITYRAGDVPGAVRSRIPSITGARQIDAELALAPTRDFAAPILGRVGPVTAEMVEKDPEAYQPGDVAGVSGLQARYDEQLRGTPGRIVRAVPGDQGADDRELYVQEPVAGKPLALTLDRRLQSLAERVLDGVGPASALVAIRPSDGSILAAANGAGTDGQNYATYGQFAPGSTFKSVTSLALLRAGLEPTSQVECTPTTTVNGKRFKNYSDYPSSSIGTIPLQEAIAQSCNTALINARGKVRDGDLAAAAASLGLGIDHDLGFPAYFGEVPKPSGETEAAADLIGQGKVLASPMAMATVIASVQAGRTVVPHLVGGIDVSVPAAAKPLTAAEARQLKALLRRVVTDGSGRGLADLPGGPVIAKTGTAEYADGGTVRTHAWMIAAQGDLAVAVFVQTGQSGSRTAGPLLEEFLRGAR
ncbi:MULTISPECIES: penicillin-binding transpeptidase domain-containing protein [unclassified Nocardioides]|uniref:penicillin-binding transpeptidase domain-containing protein n=1 Tax=unclassified Nocardioides TaxID=2615069 RepID=UPI00070271D9|nr:MULTISPECIES: penicillin-binding transpeptidase domain-containing protein [unclassified Nocardioides]KRC53578.1 penicillin-binding protein [Nocardioides sp. Root79]KRC67946.1 penicillin-binding protein [Nocardioides sp. Root240]